MTFVYTVCFLLLAIGIILLLGLTPDSVSVDLMKFISPHQTLRDKALLASGKKKSHKLTVSLNRMRDALEATGKGNQFTILTTAPNASVSPLHDRMPLVLTPDEIRPWIGDWQKAEKLLYKVPPMLDRRQEYEQLSLF